MKTKSVFFSSLLAISCAFQGQHHHGGGCGGYAMDISREESLWKDGAVAAGSLLPLGKKVRMELDRTQEADLPLPPEKALSVGGVSFAGAIPFEVLHSGRYRFSAGSRIWFDVVDLETKKLLVSEDHAMRLGCPVLKIVIFSLEASRRYALQVSSSPDEAVFVSLTEDVPATAL